MTFAENKKTEIAYFVFSDFRNISRGFDQYESGKQTFRCVKGEMDLVCLNFQNVTASQIVHKQENHGFVLINTQKACTWKTL